MRILGYNKSRMAVEKHRETRTSSHLPPREYWLYDPASNEPQPTPVDDHGLVMAEAVVATALSAIHPDYKWRTDLGSDVHHLYWPGFHYPDLPRAGANPHEHRQLPINQIILPREVHSVIHAIMEPPSIPSTEVMQSRILANAGVRKLLRRTAMSTNLHKEHKHRYVEESRFQRGSEYNVLQFLIEKEEVEEEVPSEFQLINLSDFDPNTPEDLHRLSNSLGRVANRANYTRAIKNGTLLSRYVLSTVQGTDATLYT